MANLKEDLGESHHECMLSHYNRCSFFKLLSPLPLKHPSPMIIHLLISRKPAIYPIEFGS